MKQIPLELLWNTQPSLANFVVGSNALVLSYLQNALDAHALPTTPAYVWGDTGSGKTHLLQAVRSALQAKDMQVGWLDATTPSSGQAAEFNADWQAVLLDDVERFDEQQQHVAFDWFVQTQAPADGKIRWVLAAGALPVTDLHMREDLRTRLGWGQTFALQPLSDAEAKQALQQSAQQRSLQLSDEVVAYMQTRFARNTGSLMALLHMLDVYALQENRPVTIPFIKQMLQEQEKQEDPEASTPV